MVLMYRIVFLHQGTGTEFGVALLSSLQAREFLCGEREEGEWV
jgi:hypothetical protein